MTAPLDSLLFLIGVYWPYMLAAAAAGAITGWLNLRRRTAGDAS